MGAGLVDHGRLWGAMDAVGRLGERNPHRADGTVWAGRNGQHLGIFALLEVDGGIVGVVGT